MSDPDFETAEEVANYMLEVTEPIVLSGNGEAMAKRFKLPQFVASPSGAIMVETQEDLNSLMSGIARAYKNLGVTRLRRFVVWAEFENPNLVHSITVSVPMRRRKIAQKPFPFEGSLERIDGFWKISDARYAVVEDDDLSKALVGHGPSLEG